MLYRTGTILDNIPVWLHCERGMLRASFCQPALIAATCQRDDSATDMDLTVWRYYARALLDWVARETGIPRDGLREQDCDCQDEGIVAPSLQYHLPAGGETHRGEANRHPGKERLLYQTGTVRHQGDSNV